MISIKQVSGIGLVIMAAGGFAGYMTQIGASNALVNLGTAPLKKMKQPYLVLVMAYLLGQMMYLVIPSAAGLAMLLIVAIYPILLGVGLSRASAAAMIATTSGITLGPTFGTSLLAAKTAGMDPTVYFVQYQLPIAVPAMLAIAFTHFFVQKYFDKKGVEQYSDPVETAVDESRPCPKWYAVFPLMPIALLLVFSKFGYESITLNTFTAMMLSWVSVVFVELARNRMPKQALADAMVMFKKMGGMFGGIVALIICAEFFATGLKHSGLIDMMIQAANNQGLGMGAMTIVLTGIVGLVTFLTGSGVGAYTSFASLAGDVAPALGGSVAQLVTPMQFAAGMIRSMSPVAGVIIIVAGAAGVSPMSIVKCTAIPMLTGVVVMVALNFILIQ